VQAIEFNRVAKELLSRPTAVTSLAWVPTVNQEQRPTYEDWARRNISHDFMFMVRDYRNTWVAAPEQELYHPALYVVPPAGGFLTTGENLSALPRYRDLLQLARDRGDVRISGSLNTSTDSTTNAPVLMVTPVYRHHPSPGSIADRQLLSQGFLVASWRTDLLMDSAMAATQRDSLRIVAHDVADGNETLLHSSHPAEMRVEADNLRHNGQIETIRVGGRFWQFRFLPTEKWLSEVNSHYAASLLFIGLAFTGLSARMLRTLARRA
jgi:CHASE1-domain containing sensor protein